MHLESVSNPTGYVLNLILEKLHKTHVLIVIALECDYFSTHYFSTMLANAVTDPTVPFFLFLMVVFPF